MTKSWKDVLLGSGLPLEYEIKRYLEDKGCIVDFEYSYLRANEANIERQFSYDIDAAYIKDDHFVTFMIECKYRHPSVRWIFAPESYGGSHELDSNAFMHPMDHFIPNKFPYSGSFPRHLGPACSKGIELTPHGDNDKSINQALMQLSYAFAPKIADAIEHQVHQLLVTDVMFYHVPVIATTADIFRLRESATIGDIKAASALEDVATPESCLVLNYSSGIELRRYNANILASMRQSLGETVLLGSLNTFTDDLDHLFSVIAHHYSPRAIVVIKADQTSFDSLFAYIDELLFPSEQLSNEIKAQREAAEKQLADWRKSMNVQPKRTTKSS